MKFKGTQLVKVHHHICQDLADGDVTAIDGIDTRGYSWAMIQLTLGAFGEAGHTITAAAEMSDSLSSDYTALKDGKGAGSAMTMGAYVGSTQDSKTYVAFVNLHLSQILRYLRTTVAIAGSTPVGEYAVTITLFGDQSLPETPENTVAFNCDS